MKHILYFLMVVLPLSTHAQKKQIFQTKLYGRGIYTNNNFGQTIDAKLPDGYVRFQNTVTAGIGIKQHVNVYKNFRIGLYAEYYKSHFKMNVPSLYLRDDLNRNPLIFEANAGIIGYGFNINKVISLRKFDIEVGFEMLYRNLISNQTKYNEGFYTDGKHTPGEHTYYTYEPSSLYPGNPYYTFDEYKAFTGEKSKYLFRQTRINLNLITSKPLIDKTKLYGLIGADIQLSKLSMEMLDFTIKEHKLNIATDDFNINYYTNKINITPYHLALRICLIYKW